MPQWGHAKVLCHLSLWGEETVTFKDDVESKSLFYHVVWVHYKSHSFYFLFSLFRVSTSRVVSPSVSLLKDASWSSKKQNRL